MALSAATSWIATIALIVLLTAAQELFLETHRRRYGLWKSTRQRHIWATQDERRMMWKAVTHRDLDGRVELARLAFIAVVVVVFIGIFALVPGLAPRR